MTLRAPKDWERHFEKAVRYYHNAKEELRAIPLNDGFYTDEKALRKAAGMCWLAVVEAAKGFLIRKGVPANKLRSADAYRHLLSQYKEIDGKFFQHYESAQQAVHIFIYYWGARQVSLAKTGFADAKFVIEKLTGNRL